MIKSIKQDLIRKYLMNTKQKTPFIQNERLDNLLDRVLAHIESARHNVIRTVNTQMVHAYWHIGKEIIEEEQNGKSKATYGTILLKNLCAQLKDKYGHRFGVRTLEDARKFYLEYPSIQDNKEIKSISHSVR